MADPFASFMAPPAGETPAQKAQRQKKEAEAQRISAQIDEELKAEQASRKKEQKKIIKVLLLGQSESGKSTTLKNLRMTYAADEWQQERIAWRAVVHLNLVRSVLTVLDVLEAELNSDEVDVDVDLRPTSPSPYQPNDTPPVLTGPIQLTETHQVLCKRLGPLRHVEESLRSALGAGAVEDTGENETSLGWSKMQTGDFQLSFRAWQDVVQGLGRRMSKGDAVGTGSPSKASDAVDVLMGCRDDVLALWGDPVIKMILKKRRVVLEDAAGFFLDDAERLLQRDYRPSDQDVVCARLRTLGIQEYRIRLGGTMPDWLLYDVGGARTVRKSWLPYFENVNAVIFLAPISAFDERLREDRSVNRLTDSVAIWSLLSASKLLEKTMLIAFLNKIDIMDRKLKLGILLKRYVPPYGDRPNTREEALKYFKDQFKAIFMSVRTKRSAYIFPTVAIDTKATARTLSAVKDGIQRELLKDANLI